jgi:hypothetical protein
MAAPCRCANGLLLARHTHCAPLGQCGCLLPLFAYTLSLPPSGPLVVSVSKQQHSTVTSRLDDPKQRQWTVMDPSLILPEYAVEIEYDWSGDRGSGSDVAPLSARTRDKEGIAPTTMVSELASLASVAAGTVVNVGL